MESLYRKYRPLTFESVVGQQHIVSTLEHAVTEGRLSHAYLFCGPRGTGKTTMARILAKSLLCERAAAAREGGAAGCLPDGDCPECRAIAEGTHPDVYELDAASRTGVDNVREEIINSVSFAPVRGAYKVYIIDEAHMLTTAAFNALLKTLEEPPAHVVFVLCTTDPQKLLETILSRCQRFDFHRISNEDLVARMRFICEQEGFAFDEEALAIVAKHACGGMRDALSTLEQLSVFGDGAVRAADARALLGEVASAVLAEFSRQIAARDTPGLFALVREQVDAGNDLLELTRDLVGHMRDVYTAAIAGARPELFDGAPERVAALVEEAGAFEGADRLARTLTVLDDAALEMRNASDPRLVLEIALTRLARPEADLTLEALAERLARVEAQLAAGVPSAPTDAARLVAPARAAAPVPRAVDRARPAAAIGVPGSVSLGAGAGVPASGGAPASRAAEPGAGAGSAGGSMGASHAASPKLEVPAAPHVAPSRAAAAAPAAAPAPQAAATFGAVSAPVPVASRSSESASTVGRALVPEATPAATSVPAAPASTPSPANDGAAAAGAPAGAPVADLGELQRKWSEVVQRVVAAQPSRGALIQNARAQQDDGSTLTVAFPRGSAFALKMIMRPDSHELVAPIVSAVFGPRTVNYIMEGDGGPTGKAPSASPQPTAPAASAAPVSAPVPRQHASAASSAQATLSAPAVPTPVDQQHGSAPAQQASAASAVPAAPGASTASAASQSAPAASTQTVDQVTGPTVLPEPDVEADRKAWEDEQVPYDEATIAAYSEDDDELPPFDVPGSQLGARSTSEPASQLGTHPSPSGSRPATAPQPAASVPASAPAAPTSAAVAVPPRAVPVVAPASAPPPVTPAPLDTPQSEDEAKAMLDEIFGAGVVFKPVDE